MALKTPRAKWSDQKVLKKKRTIKKRLWKIDFGVVEFLTR